MEADLVRLKPEGPRPVVDDGHRLDFADAYLVASAERTGVGAAARFDRGTDRVGTVRRVEPTWAICAEPV